MISLFHRTDQLDVEPRFPAGCSIARLVTVRERRSTQKRRFSTRTSLQSLDQPRITPQLNARPDGGFTRRTFCRPSSTLVNAVPGSADPLDGPHARRLSRCETRGVRTASAVPLRRRRRGMPFAWSRPPPWRVQASVKGRSATQFTMRHGLQNHLDRLCRLLESDRPHRDRDRFQPWAVPASRILLAVEGCRS